MRTVVDTSVWIDYLKFEVNSETTALQHLVMFAPHEVLVLNVVGFELYCGLRSAKERAYLESVLLPTSAVDIGPTASAIAAGDRFAYLRRRGITIRSPVDVLIASYCLDNGHQLLARDRDFDHFVTHFGLRRYAPPATTPVI